MALEPNSQQDDGGQPGHRKTSVPVMTPSLLPELPLTADHATKPTALVPHHLTSSHLSTITLPSVVSVATITPSGEGNTSRQHAPRSHPRASPLVVDVSAFARDLDEKRYALACSLSPRVGLVEGLASHLVSWTGEGLSSSSLRTGTSHQAYPLSHVTTMALPLPSSTSPHVHSLASPSSPSFIPPQITRVRQPSRTRRHHLIVDEEPSAYYDSDEDDPSDAQLLDRDRAIAIADLRLKYRTRFERLRLDMLIPGSRRSWTKPMRFLYPSVATKKGASGCASYLMGDVLESGSPTSTNRFDFIPPGHGAHTFRHDEQMNALSSINHASHAPKKASFTSETAPNPIHTHEFSVQFNTFESSGGSETAKSTRPSTRETIPEDWPVEKLPTCLPSPAQETEFSSARRSSSHQQRTTRRRQSINWDQWSPEKWLKSLTRPITFSQEAGIFWISEQNKSQGVTLKHKVKKFTGMLHSMKRTQENKASVKQLRSLGHLLAVREHFDPTPARTYDPTSRSATPPHGFTFSSHASSAADVAKFIQENRAEVLITPSNSLSRGLDEADEEDGLALAELDPEFTQSNHWSGPGGKEDTEVKSAEECAKLEEISMSIHRQSRRAVSASSERRIPVAPDEPSHEGGTEHDKKHDLEKLNLKDEKLTDKQSIGLPGLPIQEDPITVRAGEPVDAVESSNSLEIPSSEEKRRNENESNTLTQVITKATGVYPASILVKRPSSSVTKAALKSPRPYGSMQVLNAQVPLSFERPGKSWLSEDQKIRHQQRNEDRTLAMDAEPLDRAEVRRALLRIGEQPAQVILSPLISSKKERRPDNNPDRIALTLGDCIRQEGLKLVGVKPHFELPKIWRPHDALTTHVTSRGGVADE